MRKEGKERREKREGEGEEAIFCIASISGRVLSLLTDLFSLQEMGKRF